ncbi:MAG: Serine-protein kinase RsbW, partial [uncultured Nocardioidaceae bacterium]
EHHRVPAARRAPAAGRQRLPRRPAHGDGGAGGTDQLHPRRHRGPPDRRRRGLRDPAAPGPGGLRAAVPVLAGPGLDDRGGRRRLRVAEAARGGRVRVAGPHRPHHLRRVLGRGRPVGPHPLAQRRTTPL